MNKLKVSIGIAIIAIASFIFIAADHLDAPDTQSNVSSDITDLYAFEGANPDNTVFVANINGLMSPSASTSFDENVLIEINIDNDGDLVEDMVIQAIPRDGVMYFFGPVAPSATGLNSVIMTDAQNSGSVDITTDANAITNTENGMSFFAGPREDPFYFDFTTFNAVTKGDMPEETGPNGGFQTAENASDTFDNTNVLSIVMEIPNSMLGGTFAHPAPGTDTQVFNVWVESKLKQ